MDALTIIVSMLGGLALFLYGMGIMSETLSRLTGGSLDRVIGKITQNRYVGFAAGAALTALVQSSSATTVLTVGFVNAGIMKLREAFGFVVGANLEATMNA
ncbi:MAG: Na/Pi symporter [Lachnospiraceae bacterium]|nr:Na/Pi symporter [Lachnospiraceae bacterium]